ncbi:MAG: hypothetical protein FRX48_07725 [Lasallia pustulata]|uniref:Thiamine triphosphatase n=1 Tax=Lasallia pustulata TaxID=136370 RepID=A0A5M8PHW6_9LECA|nr:MAG: hypothetical protein FRX48_07725 [Lasallia pustulata]
MALLEVEQKFVFCLSRLSKFRANQGTPPFRQLKFLGVRCFEDVYYDYFNTLSSKGIWIRKRDYEWQAKQSIQGTFTRSTFAETNDPKEIRDLIIKHLPQSAEAEDGFRLPELCRFKTSRENYLADGKFNIALDKTNFGHAVGEVELMAEDAPRAHKEIEDFMEHYSWFFGREPPKGKLTAYFEKYGMPSALPAIDYSITVW